MFVLIFVLTFAGAFLITAIVSNLTGSREMNGFLVGIGVCLLLISLALSIYLSVNMPDAAVLKVLHMQ